MITSLFCLLIGGLLIGIICGYFMKETKIEYGENLVYNPKFTERPTFYIKKYRNEIIGGLCGCIVGLIFWIFLNFGTK